MLQLAMTEYIHAQMADHAKALEIYTQAFHYVQSMDEDDVVEVRSAYYRIDVP